MNELVLEPFHTLGNVFHQFQGRVVKHADSKLTLN